MAITTTATKRTDHDDANFDGKVGLSNDAADDYQDVIEEEDGGAAVEGVEEAGLGEFEGESEGALLSFRGEGSGGPVVEDE